jgi:hypothetical protein
VVEFLSHMMAAQTYPIKRSKNRLDSLSRFSDLFSIIGLSYKVADLSNQSHFIFLTLFCIPVSVQRSHGDKVLSSVIRRSVVGLRAGKSGGEPHAIQTLRAV